MRKYQIEILQVLKVRENSNSLKSVVSITVSCIIFCDFLQYGTPSNGHVSHIGGVTPF